MQDLAFTAYDADWNPLPKDAPERRLWTPEQIEVYDAYTYRNLTRRTPADFARMTTKGWIDFPHITFISDLISLFVRDQLLAPNGRPAKRLFLTMPPRHGKSFLLSQHVPAWYLSQYPDRHVILTTYEAKFAAKWGGKVRDLLQDHGSKYGLGLDPSIQAKDRWSLAKPHLGGMLTAGMGGPITGEGAGLLIGDDWVKNSAEANSEPWRKEAWDWYNTTFKTRFQKDLQDPAAVQPKMLLLMTRWHDDDPMGRLLARQAALGGGGDMVVVHLPCLAGEEDPLGRQPGEALCTQIMSREEALDERAADPSSFEALYQGNPTPEEGGLFSKSHFRYWRYARSGASESAEGELLTDTYVLVTPEGAIKPYRRSECRHFITTDLAISEKKRADFTVYACWALTPARDLLLVGRYRGKIEEADHLPTLQTFHDDMQATLGGPAAAGGAKIRLVGIEKASFGLSLFKNGRRKSSMPLRELDADLDKYARAIPAGAICKAGQFYLPESADWAEEWIGEHTAFPNGAHDDMVDTSAYAAQVCETTFRTFSARPTPQEAAEEAGLGAHAAHIDKIAKRNARIRRQRARNNVL